MALEKIGQIEGRLMQEAEADQVGNYRGKLGGNPYDPDSTSNRFGRYGSPFSPDSLNNPYGAGNPLRYDSPTNPYGRGWRIEGSR